MPDGVLSNLLGLLAQPTSWFIALVTLISGVVRGFSGFGGALILVPVASAVLGPRIAVPTFYLSDLGSATPYGVAKIFKCRWTAVTPMLIGTWLTQPLGALLLETLNPLMIRWTMDILVFAMLALLLSGWRFKGEPKPWISFVVGAFAGGMGGATGISAPPVIAYWLGGRGHPAQIRTDIMVYYAFSSLAIDVIYLVKGIFTWQIVGFAAIVWPCYTIGLTIGARLFTGSSDRTFRLVAYGLIATSAVISMPVFDGWVR